MGWRLWPYDRNRPRQRPVDPLRTFVGDRRQDWRSDQDRTGDRRRRLDRQIDRSAFALRNQDRRRRGRSPEIPARRRAAECRLKRPWRPAKRPGHKIAKTTPCKVEWAPRLAALVLRCVRGTRRKMVRRHGPHLISSRSSTWNHKSVLQPILRDGHFVTSSG